MAKSIEVTLELNNKQYNRALKQSQSQTNAFATSSKSLIGGVAGAFAALGGAAVMKSIVDVGARFQDLNNSLNVVFGSVDAGAAAFERVKDFATGTQFSVETLTKAFVQLKGAGVAPTDELLSTFANTASVTTDQLGTFQAMVDLVTRSTAGGMGLEDLNRLADRGVPVFTILQDKLGLTRLQVSEFGKTAEGSRKILEALTAELDNRFGNALENSENNISRLTNNLGDAFDSLSNSLFALVSEDLAKGIKRLTDLINGLSSSLDAIAASGTDLKKVFGGLVAVVLLLFNPFNKLKAVYLFLKNLLKPLAAGFSGLSKVMSTLSKNASNAFAVFKVNMKAALGSKTSQEVLKNSKVLKDYTGILGKLGVFAFNAGVSLFAYNKITEETTKTTEELKKEAEDLQNAFVGPPIPQDLLDKQQADVKALKDRITELSAAAKKFSLNDYRSELEQLTDRHADAEKALGDLLVAYSLSNNTLDDYETLLAAARAEIEASSKALNDYNNKQKDAGAKLQTYTEFMRDLKEETVRIINTQRHAADALKFFTQATEDGFISAEAFAIIQERLNGILGITEEKEDKAAKGMDIYREAIEEAGTALTDYKLLQELLNELFTTGQITLTEYNAAIRDLDEQFSQNEGLNNFLDALGSAQVALSQDLAQAFMDGESAGDSFQKFFKKMVKQIIADILRLQIIQPILSSIMAPFGFGFGSGGSVVKLPSGNGGGYTGSGARAGGVDGKGGFPAILHPNETVIDHTKGQGMGAVQNTAVTYNINAVDARSFKELVASDPEYLYNVTQVGARRQPR